MINGPNLDKMGVRDPKLYGSFSLEKLADLIGGEFPEHRFDFFQSGLEGELIQKLHNAPANYDGVIINPGGYAHTSVALRDAIEIINIPVVEVHMSNLSSRENFRQSLLTASVCLGYISGFEEYSYIAGIYLLTKIIKQND